MIWSIYHTNCESNFSVTLKQLLLFSDRSLLSLYDKCLLFFRFDEIFYGRFASMYINNIFYFDMHPPLGKMILALAGYIGNFDGGAKFDRIGAGLI